MHLSLVCVFGSFTFISGILYLNWNFHGHFSGRYLFSNQEGIVCLFYLNWNFHMRSVLV